MDSSSRSDRARMASSGWLHEIRFGRFCDVVVALPALVLELEVLDRHCVRIRVQIRKRLEFGHPCPIDLECEHGLACLVVDLDDEILAEALQRNLGTETGSEIPYLVGPLLEIDVVRDSALERDRLVLCSARRFVRSRWVSPVAVLDHLGSALERAALGNACDVVAVPFHAELEILVGIEPSRVDGELCHAGLL